MKYIKRFNENFNKMDSIDMKDIKVVFDFYSNQDVIPRKIYITSKDEIKLGDGYLKLYDDGDVSEICFCDNFLEWFDESDRTP